jgi:mRNA-degrading endonuclease YafQ of YafQ-DinJ toxin-antitoxin module
MKLVLSSKFQKDRDKLLGKNPQIRKKVAKTLKLMQKNINHPSLRLHKLAGTNIWSVSVDMDLRIKFYLVENKLFLLEIGSHDEVY